MLFSSDWLFEIAQKKQNAINQFLNDYQDISIDMFEIFGNYGLVHPMDSLLELYKLPDIKDYDVLIFQTNSNFYKDYRQQMIDEAHKYHIPVVSINDPIKDCVYVGTDNQQAIYKLTQTISAERNCQKVAYVSGPMSSREARLRKADFLQATKDLEDIQIIEGASCGYPTNEKDNFELKKEEQINLFNKYQKGDKNAFKKLINHNLGLSVTIAKTFIGSTTSVINIFDLINEGNLALINAVKSFNPEKDVKFSSYAGIIIKQQLTKYVLENSKGFNINIHTMQRINKLKSIINTNPNLNDQELANILNISISTVKNYKLFLLNILSLNVRISDDIEEDYIDYITYEDAIDPCEQVIKKLEYEIVKSKLSLLNEKELDIIKLYFKENLTLKEIGEKYNLTKQRISKILNNALYKLKYDYERLEKNINKSR
mgnify:CR=1 FL=1